MISFIIIGRNEGWKLTKCLTSVFETIDHNKFTDYEVVYIDSNSTDNSLDRAKSFEKTKIFKITGICNAAIARNIGVEESVGETLFFIDGDMEIRPDFLPLVYNEKVGLKHSFVSGQLKNFNYDANSILINNTWQYKDVLKEDKYFTTTGGIFLIKRSLWLEVGGMDTKFRRGQDMDIALSLARKGTKILRKKDVVANHHTIMYVHKDRIWDVLFNGGVFYARSLLYRKHILNKHLFKKFIKTEYSLAFLVLITFFAIFSGFYCIYFFYFPIILVRIYKSQVKNTCDFLNQLVYYPTRDILVLYGFVFFFPQRVKDYKYVPIY